MLIKAGVEISRLKREIRRSLNPVGAWVVALGEELVVTSTYEGNHMDGSLHYNDNAYDLRRPKNADAGEIERVRLLLGDEYDLRVYSSLLHVEYDP